MLNTSEILRLAAQENTLEIIALCRQALIEEAAKERGGSTLLKRTKAAQKMLNSMAEDELPRCGAVLQRRPDGSTYQSFIYNGHFGFMLNDEIQGLPQGDAEKTLNMSKYIANAESQMTEEREQDIDIVAVRAFLREHKALHKGQRKVPTARWQVGSHFYDAQYIIDCFTVLGGKVRFYQDENRPLSAAILESENGKAVLLPLDPLESEKESKP